MNDIKLFIDSHEQPITYHFVLYCSSGSCSDRSSEIVSVRGCQQEEAFGIGRIRGRIWSENDENGSC